jgi:hypothetical protein
MTVAIAGLTYSWMMGLFNPLTQSTSNQLSQIIQVTSFSISQIYVSNGNIYAIVYNNGNVPINTNNLTITAQEYYASNNTYDGTTYTCSASSSIIASNQQSTITLSCNPSGLTNNWNSGLYYYLFTFVYKGVSVQATLPPP